MIKTVQTQCKFCKKTIYPEFDTNCDIEWLDKLAPMLCCNQCADVRMALRGQTEHFVTLCVALQRKGERSVIETEMRRVLSNYGWNYGMIQSDNRVQISPVELQSAIEKTVLTVLAKPDSGLTFLGGYRYMIRQLLKGKQCNQKQATEPAMTSEPPSPRSYVD